MIRFSIRHVKTYTAECHTQPSNVRALRRELRHKHHKTIKTETEECYVTADSYNDHMQGLKYRLALLDVYRRRQTMQFY